MSSSARPDFDVFVSYNIKDAERVHPICEELEGRGVRVWIDVKQIPPQKDLLTVAASGILRSKSALVFVGENGLGNTQKAERDLIHKRVVQLEMEVITAYLPGASEADIPVELQQIVSSTQRPVRFQETPPFSDLAAINDLIWGITGRQPRGWRYQLQFPVPFVDATFLASSGENQELVEAVREACRQMGMDVNQAHNALDEETYEGDVVMAVRKSNFVVVDFTAKNGDIINPMAMYQAGLANSLRKPVLAITNRPIVEYFKVELKGLITLEDNWTVELDEKAPELLTEELVQMMRAIRERQRYPYLIDDTKPTDAVVLHSDLMPMRSVLWPSFERILSLGCDIQHCFRELATFIHQLSAQVEMVYDAVRAETGTYAEPTRDWDRFDELFFTYLKAFDDLSLQFLDGVGQRCDRMRLDFQSLLQDVDDPQDNPVRDQLESCERFFGLVEEAIVLFQEEHQKFLASHTPQSTAVYEYGNDRAPTMETRKKYLRSDRGHALRTKSVVDSLRNAVDMLEANAYGMMSKLFELIRIGRMEGVAP